MTPGRLAAAALALALAPCVAAAVGLGEVSVRSHLNEPLRARIALVSVAKGDMAGMKIALADDAAFARAGLPRPDVLRGLRFEPVPTAAGGYIEVTSREPIREPALDFVLDVAWPGGRALREYSIVLGRP